ncbi:hypothetical protein EV379_0849 [Microterricola gilva]|uniref:Uncharacterized protein n=2 Tax=Microterricola gilva TaxID=393267 RepID=A0A4Q8AL10_9MICO|nr:hypothetical protein EV379_0849 [Microterricola gilva]
MERARTPESRLAQFRSEWPTSVSWREVREEDPTAFRSAVHGALLLPLAVLATLVAVSLSMEIPIAISLPDWLDWMRGLILVAAFWVMIGLCIWSLVLLSLPFDARRGIAIARFAQERGLLYSRNGFAPDRLGIFFAEGRGRPAPRRPVRLAHQLDPSRGPLFLSAFSLWRGTGAPNPSLQIAVASYTGGKSDPKGPRHAFRFMEMGLPRTLPHLMIDARRNGSLRSLLPGTQRLSLEGDFDRYFTVYAPQGYERDALQLLTPDVMVCLIDHGRRWDIEIIEDRLIVASSRFRRRSDRADVTAMLLFSELIGAELGRQAAYYTDPRADQPRTQVASAGRRLRLRSAAWTTAIFALVVAAMLTFPHVLGWILDNN